MSTTGNFLKTANSEAFFFASELEEKVLIGSLAEEFLASWFSWCLGPGARVWPGCPHSQMLEFCTLPYELLPRGGSGL